MATRPNPRTKQTPSAIQPSPAGIIGVSRNAIPAAPTITTVTIPAGVNSFVCKNVGLNPIRMNFGSDTASNYWEIAGGATTPTINVSPGVLVRLAAIGLGGSTLETIFWG